MQREQRLKERLEEVTHAPAQPGFYAVEGATGARAESREEARKRRLKKKSLGERLAAQEDRYVRRAKLFKLRG